MRCRSVSLNAELMPVFAGALFKLTHASAWEQHGTLTPDDAALLALAMYDSIRDEGDCMSEVSGVMDFYGSDPGSDWLLCDGSSYLREDYPGLYDRLDAIGSTLIVDADNFLVPNLIGRFRYGNLDTPNGTGGAETHTLNINQLPAHSHSIPEGIFTYFTAVSPGELPVAISSIPGNTGLRGAGQSHNNMPPYNTAIPYMRAR